MNSQVANKKIFALTDRRVCPGWLLFISDQGRFVVLEPDPAYKSKLVIPVQHRGTGEKRVFTVSELDTLSRNGVDVIFAPSTEELDKLINAPDLEEAAVPITLVDDHLLEKADRIIGSIQLINILLEDKERRCIASGVKFRRDKALREICESLQSGQGTYYLGRSSYYHFTDLISKVDGDRIRFALSLHRSTYQKTKAPKAAVHFVDAVILKHCANRGSAKTKTELYTLVEGYYKHTQGWWVDPEKCKDVPANLVEELMNLSIPLDLLLDNPEKANLLTKIKRPSRAWFYRHYHWFVANPEQGVKTIIERYGQEFYEQNVIAFDTFVYQASLPLQYVFADHCLLDIFVVDKETRTIIFKVWVTLLIDCYSRCILGMAVLVEDPCIESIQSALANAIWEKTEFLAGLGLEYPDGEGWEMYGIPASLYLDNAWAHHSHSFENLARNISFKGRYNSIEVNFRPPYKGRYGALIERYLGNLQAKIKDALAGAITTKGYSGVRNAAKEARLLVADIKRAIAQLNVIYMHTPHSELGGMTPHEKWLEGMASGWPQVPAMTPANERLFWRSSSETRAISTKRGISAFGLSYRSDQLQLCERVGKDGRPVRYSYNYEPIDISRIALFRDGTYICDLYAKELRLPDNTYLHVGIAERRLAQKIAVNSGQSSLDWLKFIHEAKKLNEQREAEQKTMKRREAAAKKAAARAPSSPILTIQDGSSQLDRLKAFSGEGEM